ncbi:XRE family transcriptional regulator [Sulfurimonas sediminis]|uniref:XRE family transcriptional regulator n=1 Tax=Sulfurimonas sediminis TaxID=2590020 RepID=A0A7M1AZP8_9BACT|nr:XRE family transcriptional regulator [Sulfurimonas sediminis]QOP42979.1 XRE family transcriptional regulator [Sulfurimonas sediminis]
MNNEEFKSLLKKASLTKKSFSELVGTSTQGINNWSNKDRGIPYWVKSWLTLYIENKECKELKEIIKANVCNG